jgi:hypothetical protein
VRFGIDKFLLRSGIRDRGDRSAGKFLAEIKRQRPPSAPQIENALTVFDSRAVGDLREREFFCFGQRTHFNRPVAGAVFETRTQD